MRDCSGDLLPTIFSNITHPKKLETFESLAGNHSDELHLTEESDLRRREAGREWKCHCQVTSD